MNMCVLKYLVIYSAVILSDVSLQINLLSDGSLGKRAVNRGHLKEYHRQLRKVDDSRRRNWNLMARQRRSNTLGVSSYLGCFAPVKDIKAKPLLMDFVIESETMDPTWCVVLCQSKHYKLAGLQNSVECHCGNSLPRKLERADDEDCDLRCIGDPRQTCGGKKLMTIMLLAKPEDALRELDEQTNGSGASAGRRSDAAGGLGLSRFRFEEPERHKSSIKGNPCVVVPCVNGGTCTRNLLKGAFGFDCTCAQGFTGSRCESRTNDCESNPCQQDSTCLATLDGFTCLCKIGYTGKLCDERQNGTMIYFTPEELSIMEFHYIFPTLSVILLILTGVILHFVRVLCRRRAVLQRYQLRIDIGEVVQNVPPDFITVSNDLCREFFCCKSQRQYDAEVPARRLSQIKLASSASDIGSKESEPLLATESGEETSKSEDKPAEKGKNGGNGKSSAKGEKGKNGENGKSAEKKNTEKSADAPETSTVSRKSSRDEAAGKERRSSGSKPEPGPAESSEAEVAGKKNGKLASKKLTESANKANKSDNYPNRRLDKKVSHHGRLYQPLTRNNCRDYWNPHGSNPYPDFNNGNVHCKVRACQTCLHPGSAVSTIPAAGQDRSECSTSCHQNHPPGCHMTPASRCCHSVPTSHSNAQRLSSMPSVGYQPASHSSRKRTLDNRQPVSLFAKERFPPLVEVTESESPLSSTYRYRR